MGFPFDRADIAQALLLSERPLVCILVYIHKGMISRVNNDVRLGLTNDQWSTPL